jgi:hypothetical protein
VLIPWDPGGSDSVIDAATGSNWNDAQLKYSHQNQTWDPGDIRGIGLRASRILRRGDCQRPDDWTGWWAATLGPSLLGNYARKAQGREQDTKEKGWLGTGWKGGFGRGVWLGECCVCVELLGSLLPP